MDYEPLDIFSLCNGGADLLEGGEDVELGHVTMRGLPFLVGGPDGQGDGACFIALGGSESGVTVPIGKAVRNVIVAHRVVDAPDDSLGTDVAEYVFHQAGGSEDRAPIQAGFQIGGAGRFPYDAFIDAKPTLMHRYEGRWANSGRRPMEALATFTKRYYLWVWRNPDPEREVEALEIIPRGPRFIVAAITLGYADEHPFPREGMRPTRITLKDEAAAGRPFSLEVGVDRGDVTYPHPLPTMTDHEFLGDSYRGWGEPQRISSSPAYVEVSATPSASLSLGQDGEDLGSVRWGDVDRDGSAETPKAKVELVDPGRNWVRVTVLDDETGRPVPCRVHFRTPEGVPYQPYGHHNRLNSNLPTDNFDIGGDVRLGQITYAYIDGTCQGWLPRGDVIVDVARGFEYDPLRAKVRIEPGQRELTLRIKRWSNMNAEGWYSGDSHVHFLSSQGAVTEAAGEDLNVVNLLQSQWGSLFTNTEDFVGEPNVARSGDTIVYVSQENRQHVMGHLILWGLKEPVMPWCTDGPGEAELAGTMEMTLSQWADACLEQGGTVIAPHIGNFGGELVALTATGRVQGMEMIRMHENAHDGYYRALNCGYRMPLVGGTDKMSADVTVGLSRTYARIPDGQDFNYDTWCRAVASGATFLSSGPMIRLSVDGREIGDTVELTGPGTVEVEASAESIFPPAPAGHSGGGQGRGIVRIEERGSAAHNQGADRGDRAHLDSGAVRRARLFHGRKLQQRFPSVVVAEGPWRAHPRHPLRRLAAGHIRPHVAGLRSVRRRLVDVRRGDGASHALSDRRQHEVHRGGLASAPPRDGHPPPRRGRPHRVPEEAVPGSACEGRRAAAQDEMTEDRGGWT